MYPTAEDRKSKMIALARKAALLEMTLGQMVNNTPDFGPYYEKALDVYKKDNDLTMLEIVSLAIKDLDKYIKENRDFSKLGVLKKFYEPVEAGLGYEADLHFMMLDWYVETLQSGREPNDTNFPLGSGQHTKMIIGQIENFASKIANKENLLHCGKTHRTYTQDDIIKEARNYWLQNVRDVPIDSYPIIKAKDFSYSEPLEIILSRGIAANALYFLVGGGFGYREAIAEMACDNMDSVLEIGTGDGFTQPALASHSELVAIDSLLNTCAVEIANQLTNEGKDVSYKNVSIENYQGQADVAVVTDASFLDINVVEHVSRVAKSRVVMGIPSLQRPLQHYALRNDRMQLGNHMQNISSFEPMRWANELGKHYNVGIYNYEHKLIVLKADR